MATIGLQFMSEIAIYALSTLQSTALKKRIRHHQHLMIGIKSEGTGLGSMRTIRRLLFVRIGQKSLLVRPFLEAALGKLVLELFTGLDRGFDIGDDVGELLELGVEGLPE